MRKSLLTVALVGALSLTLSACGDDAEDTGSGKADASKPVAQIDNLTGKMTQVTLDSAFVTGLKTLGLTPGTVGTATISPEGVATFPITGGNATYYTPGTKDPYVTGLINHDGSGLSLSAGGTKVELKNFDVDPGASMLTGDVTANGTTVVENTPLFFLDGSTLKPLDTSTGDGVLEGTQVKIAPGAAALLNKTFKTDKVQDFALVGIAKITLTVPAAK